MKKGRQVTRYLGADHTQPPAGHQVIEFWSTWANGDSDLASYKMEIE